MPKIESEKIDCLHRPCSRPAPRGKIESVRTHSEVIEQFDSFSLLKLFFLIRNWHCWSPKAFPRQMTPQSREKTAKTAVFRHRWQAWKVNGGSSRLKRVKNHGPSSWSSAPTLIIMAASLGSIWQEAACCGQSFAVATDWLVEAGSHPPARDKNASC